MWGAGSYGALGQGTVAPHYSPVQVGALTNWKKVSFGRDFCIALKTDGTIWSWGRNTAGQLGTGQPPGNNASSPVQIGSLTTWEKIFPAYGNMAFAIKISLYLF